MFSNILGIKKKNGSGEDSKYADLVNKISKMNLTDMRQYINNKVPDAPIDEQGLIEVLKRLNSKNENTSKRFIESDDMDTKIKKAFDLVIAISGHKSITVVAVEQVREFIDMYNDIIVKYDTRNKQIYDSKLKDLLNSAIEHLKAKSELSMKIDLINK